MGRSPAVAGERQGVVDALVVLLRAGRGAEPKRMESYRVSRCWLMLRLSMRHRKWLKIRLRERNLATSREICAALARVRAGREGT